MIPPATTATTTATRVEFGAAASATVRPGSTSGRWATAQPATIAATAAPAANRAGSSRRRQTSPRANSPSSTETIAQARPAPWVSPSNRRGASACTTASPPTATAPASTPLTSARRRKAATAASSPTRTASAASCTAARYAPSTTASTPTRIEVGLSQLLHWSPPPPGGTRPDAIAPTTAPSANGVKTDDSPNTASISRWSSGPFDAPCSAYAVPRRISPTAARNSGTTSVMDTAANTLGYASTAR